MKFDRAEILTRLTDGSRYDHSKKSPGAYYERTSRDGGFCCDSAFDTVLERFVEYWTEVENLNSEYAESWLLIEAVRFGALGHPHIPRTLDFGVNAGDERGFYFTREITGGDFSNSFFYYGGGAFRLEIYDTLLERGEFWLSREDTELLRNRQVRALEPNRSNQHLREARRSAHWRDATFVFPASDEHIREYEGKGNKWKRLLDKEIISQDEANAQLDRLKEDCFNNLLRDFYASNKTVLALLPKEQLVVLNLHHLIDVFLKAANTLDFAHQHGVFNRGFDSGFPRPIQSTDNGHVWLVNWIIDHISFRYRKPPASDRNNDVLEDLFGLASSLRYCLRDTYGKCLDDYDGPFRRDFYPFCESDQGGIHALLLAVDQVCLRVTAPQPHDRQQSMAAFADDIRACLAAHPPTA